MFDILANGGFRELASHTGLEISPQRFGFDSLGRPDLLQRLPGWQAESLHMGVLHGVSRYVGETLAGIRLEAERLHLRLNARNQE